MQVWKIVGEQPATAPPLCRCFWTTWRPWLSRWKPIFCGGPACATRRRNGAEIFYRVLKPRSDLENRPGLGAEAVHQDFHATVCLTGLESMLT